MGQQIERSQGNVSSVYAECETKACHGFQKKQNYLGFRIAVACMKLFLSLQQQPGSVPHLVGNAVAPEVKLKYNSTYMIMSESTARHDNDKYCDCAFFPEVYTRDGA